MVSSCFYLAGYLAFNRQHLRLPAASEREAEDLVEFSSDGPAAFGGDPTDG